MSSHDAGDLAWGVDGADAERSLAVARVVADYWREAMLRREDSRWAAHPLCMVLAAIDGETDPRELGIEPEHDHLVTDAAERPVPRRLVLSGEEEWTVLCALDDYGEWAADTASDKRSEAERTDPADAGLLDEADWYEGERTRAVHLHGRLAGVEARRAQAAMPEQIDGAGS